MPVYLSDEVATDANFDERAYLESNPDVAIAVQQRVIESGRVHFDRHGRQEGRTIRLSAALSAAKQRKLARLRPLLRRDLACVARSTHYDFLGTQSPPAIRADGAGGSHGYDAHAQALIERHAEGLVLDLGAGRRRVYFDNVVNFDAIDYATTDVRGLGETLPFVDAAFDAVISMAALEHVRDPFLGAREIVRILKPGGSLMCCVPFLQPRHAHTQHYYNMTDRGLCNLFAELIEVDRVTVYGGLLPIAALSWIVQSWDAGLHGHARAAFRAMRIDELLRDPAEFMQAPFVTELSPQKNLELASATVLFAHKPHAPAALAALGATPPVTAARPARASLPLPARHDFRIGAPRALISPVASS